MTYINNFYSNFFAELLIIMKANLYKKTCKIEYKNIYFTGFFTILKIHFISF
jgi:hypothetical protein